LSYGQLASKIAELSGAIVMVPDFPLAPVGNYHATWRARRWLGHGTNKNQPFKGGVGGHD